MNCLGAVISGIIAGIFTSTSAADDVVRFFSFLSPDVVVVIGVIGGAIGAITLTPPCIDYFGE